MTTDGSHRGIAPRIEAVCSLFGFTICRDAPLPYGVKCMWMLVPDPETGCIWICAPTVGDIEKLVERITGSQNNNLIRENRFPVFSVDYLRHAMTVLHQMLPMEDMMLPLFEGWQEFILGS